MTTFYTQIFTCSGCGRKLRNFQLSSYHVFDSDVYSDAWVDSNPPVMFGNNIVFCPACDYPHWAYDIIEEDYPQDDDNVLRVKDMGDFIPFGVENRNIEQAQYLLSLINRDFTKEDHSKELLIRLDIWRILNHQFRYSNVDKSEKIYGWIKKHFYKGERNWDEEYEEIFIRNLTSLIEIFEPYLYDEILLAAEMYREIGDFDKALVILNTTKVNERNKAYTQIKNEILHKRKKVIKLDI